LNKLAFILAAAVIGFVGYLYIGEKSEFRSATAAVTAAADSAAV
jgi:hypothetical protein